MKRRFNITGPCFADEHYMVDLTWRIAEVRKMIERRDYFAINRGRQYGKTTMLYAIEQSLKENYIIVSLDFQEMDNAVFENSDVFSKSFCNTFREAIETAKETRIGEDAIQKLKDFETSPEQKNLKCLSSLIYEICDLATCPIVLIIDEVDSATNNQVFIDFLAMLRLAYINRKKKPTFQSVILAGVYDIRHLKAKIRPEEEHKINSPWNIAANFDMRMWFNEEDIVGMLGQYEEDNNVEIDKETIAKKLVEYTAGYPVMVSWLCKAMDEECGRFDLETMRKAAKRMLQDGSVAVFDSMMHHIELYGELKTLLKELVFCGKKIQYVPDVYAINLGIMFCYLKKKEEECVISNWIFEQRLVGYFIFEEARSESFQAGERAKNQFITPSGRLDMDLVMRKFTEHFQDIYNGRDERFMENMGRKLFMLYMRPIINGTGNYYIEAETRDATRSDLIIDYGGERFVVEMKIWHGEEYNKRGEEQLKNYLDYFHLTKGYMLSFCFNKNKRVGVDTIMVDGKAIVEAVV